MHYLTHSFTQLCQGRMQWYKSWEGIPMHDYSGNEGVFIGILECGYLSI